MWKEIKKKLTVKLYWYYDYSKIPPRRNCENKFPKKLLRSFQILLKNSAVGTSFSFSTTIHTIFLPYCHLYMYKQTILDLFRDKIQRANFWMNLKWLFLFPTRTLFDPETGTCALETPDCFGNLQFLFLLHWLWFRLTLSLPFYFRLGFAFLLPFWYDDFLIADIFFTFIFWGFSTKILTLG